jgi:hypothetical protein
MGDVSEMHASDVLNPERWRARCDPKCDDVMAVFLFGSWNVRVSSYIRDFRLLVLETQHRNPKLKSIGFTSIKVDTDDESYELCISDTNETQVGLGAPSELPAIVFLGRPSSYSSKEKQYGATYAKIRVEHMSLYGRKLDCYMSTAKGWNELLDDMQSTLSRLIDSEGKLLPLTAKQNTAKLTIRTNPEPAVRLFIAGDRSQVGKSSICLGILGSLLKSGKYSPSDLAYIKPATQCEQTQLVQEFCKSKGITSCVPIGPIVYYKGFTRAFLKGDIGETSEQLLYKAGYAVDELAVGKKVVIIDGVGMCANDCFKYSMSFMCTLTGIL